MSEKTLSHLNHFASVIISRSKLEKDKYLDNNFPICPVPRNISDCDLPQYNFFIIEQSSQHHSFHDALKVHHDTLYYNLSLKSDFGRIGEKISNRMNFNPLMCGSNKSSYILKKTSSVQLQVCLSNVTYCYHLTLLKD